MVTHSMVSMATQEEGVYFIGADSRLTAYGTGHGADTPLRSPIRGKSEQKQSNVTENGI